MNEIYYLDRGDRNLQLTETELYEGVRSGRFSLEDTICQEGWENWRMVGEVFPRWTLPPRAPAVRKPVRSDLSYSGRTSWINEFPKIFIGGFLLLVGLASWSSGDPSSVSFGKIVAGCGVLLLAAAAYRRFSTRFVIADGRIEATLGIVARKQNSIKLKNLRAVEMNQGFFQRLLGVGDVGFSSAAGTTVDVNFSGISSPSKLKSEVENWLEEGE